jgi:hypothetical protein
MDDHFVGYEAGFTARRYAAEARFAGKRSMGQSVAGDSIESWSPDRKRTMRERMALPRACRIMRERMALSRACWTVLQTMWVLLARHSTRNVADRMTVRRYTSVRRTDSTQTRRHSTFHGSGL